MPRRGDDAFDVTTATSLLAPSWTVILPGDGRQKLTRHGTFTTLVAQPRGDEEVIAAMAQSVGELSDFIAATVKEGKNVLF